MPAVSRFEIHDVRNFPGIIDATFLSCVGDAVMTHEHSAGAVVETIGVHLCRAATLQIVIGAERKRHTWPVRR
jgi:hypothetical protein